uniref:Uncharacterized protein n=1 Tax=Rhizophora mucronata TaxID=61149 RepID=A0A2P2J7A7_RHIMU
MQEKTCIQFKKPRLIPQQLSLPLHPTDQFSCYFLLE